MNVYGIAQVHHKEETKRTMLMDFIPGPSGKKAYEALQKCRDTFKISHAEYCGAVQFITRRLLDVTRHLGKAGVVHNDIRPENFLVNEETGEPVVIDLGFLSKKGGYLVGYTPGYAAPEAKLYKGVDERSDVFTVGATVLDGMEGGKVFPPNKGLHPGEASKNRKGNAVREPGSYSAKTAWTNFLEHVMEPDRDRRVDSKAAKYLDFVNHRMLDDDAAKEVIKKAISLASMEEQKPKEEQEPVEEQKPVKEQKRKREQNPEDAQARRKMRVAKLAVMPDKVKHVIKVKGVMLDKVKEAVKESATPFITNTPWFGAAQIILEAVPKMIKSGVDEDGRRPPYNENQHIDPDYERSVMSARQNLAPYAVEIENLRRYANDAENFI